MPTLNLWPLVAYFLLSCLLMVLFTIGPDGIIGRLLPQDATNLLAAWTPNLSAAVVIACTAGPSGLARWLNGYGKWRVGLGWYLAALSPLVIAFLDPAIFVLLGGSLQPSGTSLSAALLRQLGWIAVLGAAGEEGGWRGFAQPLLQVRLAVAPASVVVGSMWAVWHIPAYFAQGLVDASHPWWPLAIWLVANAVIMGWIWNGTQGSTLHASLYHFAFNASWPIADAVLQKTTTGPFSTYLSEFLYVVYAVAVIWAIKRKTGLPETERGTGKTDDSPAPVKSPLRKV